MYCHIAPFDATRRIIHAKKTSAVHSIICWWFHQKLKRFTDAAASSWRSQPTKISKSTTVTVTNATFQTAPNQLDLCCNDYKQLEKERVVGCHCRWVVLEPREEADWKKRGLGRTVQSFWPPIQRSGVLLVVCGIVTSTLAIYVDYYSILVRSNCKN